MSRKTGLVYTLFGIGAIITVVAVFCIRVNTARQSHLRAIESQFDSLKKNVISSYLAKGSFESSYFSKKIKDFFSENNRCKALAVYTESGIEYVYAVDTHYLQFNPQSVSSWQGTPQFSTASFFEKTLVSPIMMPTQKGFFIAAVFSSISKAELFLFLRDSCIALGVLFLLTVLLMILYKPVSRSRPKPAAAESSPAESDIGSDSDETAADAPKTGESIVNKSNGSQGSGLFSPDSGLGWESFLESRLSFELRRSAANDQDLTLFIIRGTNLHRDQEQYKKMASALLNKFSYQDLLFEYGHNGFAVVMPSIELEKGIKEVEEFIKTLCPMKPEDCVLSAGLSSRNGRLLNGNRLIAEAARALSKASSDPKNKIVGFRSDPEKYRQFIASRI